MTSEPSREVFLWAESATQTTCQFRELNKARHKFGFNNLFPDLFLTYNCLTGDDKQQVVPNFAPILRLFNFISLRSLALMMMMNLEPNKSNTGAKAVLDLLRFSFELLLRLPLL